MKILRQITLLFAICAAGDFLSAFIGEALPGNVLGMALLLLLLLTRIVKPDAVETAADFFLGNMSVLFIPAALGILRVYPQIRNELLKLALICFVTTFLTAACTGWAVMLAQKMQRKGVREGWSKR